MNKRIQIALLALTSALLVLATSSCETDPVDTPTSQCQVAKHIKDSTIFADANINL
ncbi:MAG: hypothetical protein K6F33_12440 [Bacteroidales bacterium]|nr:hypothetical protein [Bacteroidales bacterium]